MSDIDSNEALNYARFGSIIMEELQIMDPAKSSEDTQEETLKDMVDSDGPSVDNVQQKVLDLYAKFKSTTDLFNEMERLRNQLALDLGDLLERLPKSQGMDADLHEKRQIIAQMGPGIHEGIWPASQQTVPKTEMVDWNTLMQTDILDVTSNSVKAPSAIEIPIDEPVGFVESGPLWKQATNTTTSPSRTPLPERIKINSRRLIYLLTRGLTDSELPWAPWYQSLHILRPFKVLTYNEARIRSLLSSFESSLQDRTERGETDNKEPSEASSLSEESSERPQLEPSIMGRAELRLFVSDLRCLTRFMDDTIQPARQKLEDEADLTNFSELWYLFPVGSLIHVNSAKYAQKVWRVIQRAGGRRYMSRPDDITPENFKHQFSEFVVDAYHMDYDGEKYVPVYGKFSISYFPGPRAVAALEISPVRIAENEGLISIEQLTLRGKAFMECTNISYKYYCGQTCARTTLGTYADTAPRKIDSGVVLDYSRALADLKHMRPITRDPNLHRASPHEVKHERLNIEKDWIWDEKAFESALVRCNILPTPNEEDLVLLPDRVFAFVLRDREWASIRIGVAQNGEKSLRDIEAPREPLWNKLYLPEGHKELIMSLVTQHYRDSTKSSTLGTDLVQAKGKGLILLLHGSPGTGKTMTAECVAEKTRKPLYALSSGDLGVTSSELDSNLDRIFSLVQAWNCILLLDEADILLREREPAHLVRNGLVAVFLRRMEYFPGLMMITTNVAGGFDAAFTSRIHVSLYYPVMNLDITCNIWSNNMKDAKFQYPNLNLNAENLLQYARGLYLEQPKGQKWNGRQINNAFKSAIALAAVEDHTRLTINLRREHFDRVLQTTSRPSDNHPYELSEPREPRPHRFTLGRDNENEESSKDHESMIRLLRQFQSFLNDTSVESRRPGWTESLDESSRQSIAHTYQDQQSPSSRVSPYPEQRLPNRQPMRYPPSQQPTQHPQYYEPWYQDAMRPQYQRAHRVEPPAGRSATAMDQMQRHATLPASLPFFPPESMMPQSPMQDEGGRNDYTTSSAERPGFYQGRRSQNYAPSSLSSSQVPEGGFWGS